MNLEPLKHFGLQPADIAVYKGLISLGETKTGPLIKVTRVASSQVYESLKKLLELGLASYQVKNNIREYRVELPDQLLNQLEADRILLSELSEHIRIQKPARKERNFLNSYEGVYGFKKAILQHTEEAEDGEALGITAFSPRITKTRELRSFFRQVDQLMLPKHCTVRMLLDRKLKNTMGADRHLVPGCEIRYLPSGYFSPSALNLSKKEVLISVWDENPIAIRIKNPAIVAGFWKNFEFLWSLSRSE